MEEKHRKSESVNSSKLNFMIPSDIQNFNKLTNGMTKITMYSWEKEGNKILKQGKLSITKEEKRMLKYLIIKRVPKEFRASLWLTTSGALREISNNPKYYHSLINDFPNSPSKFETQIEMDLKRTFPGIPYFQESNTMTSMKNILLAYTRRNSSIGYCQGFNFIVGRLLSILENEEHCFWVFTQMIENYLPINYYSEMAGVITDQIILTRFIALFFKEMTEHFKEHSFDITTITLQWFVSLFSQNLDSEMNILIWDVFFLDGSVVIFKAAFAVLRLMESDILKQNSFEDLYALFDSTTKNLNDPQTFLYNIILKKYEFDGESIAHNRAHISAEVYDNITKSKERTRKILETKNPDKKNRLSFVKPEVVCDTNWPFCIRDIGYRDNIIDCLSFQIKPSNHEYIENYLDSEDVTKNKGKSKEVTYDTLLIERRLHKCQTNDSENQRKRGYTLYIGDQTNEYKSFITDINSKYKEIDSKVGNIIKMAPQDKQIPGSDDELK